MATIVQDLFTDTDGTLLASHTPNVGSAWEALNVNSTGSANFNNAEISAGKLRSFSTVMSQAYRNLAVPPSAEYSVSATLNFGAANGSGRVQALLARVSPTGTGPSGVDFYTFRYDRVTAGAEKWILAKNVAGVHTVLDQVLEVASGDLAAEFVCTNASKTGKVGGVTKVSSVDNSITQVGHPGVAAARSGTGTVDDFLAATISAAEISATAAATLPALQASGAGAVVVAAVAGGSLPSLQASGAAAATVAAGAAATLPALGGAGTAAVEVTAGGAATLPVITGSGAATVDVVAGGSPTLPSLTGSGTIGGTPPIEAVSSATLPALGGSGAAAIPVQVVSAAILPRLGGSGGVVLQIAAAGAGVLPRLTGAGVLTLDFVAPTPLVEITRTLYFTREITRTLRF